MLNIDPKTRAIKNEKLLISIEQIAAFPESTEIQLSFFPSQTDRNAGTLTDVGLLMDSNSDFIERPKHGKKKLFSRISNADDTDGIFRRYICRTAKERDMVKQPNYYCLFETQPYLSRPARLYKTSSVLG